MLAQSFKSAEELRLSEEQKDALIKVLVLLETDQLRHTKTVQFLDKGIVKFSGHFNMRAWKRTAECGTVACIGGTAELISSVSLIATSCVNSALNDLFCPNTVDVGWYNNITTAQAAQALRNYLTTGNAQWKDVIPESQKAFQRLFEGFVFS